ncbi:serine hydrolase domain-containing protein [Pontibacter actiniarum]|nr:serine hydrolase domain-containing protein [Pontibacter actiniarum]
MKMVTTLILLATLLLGCSQPQDIGAYLTELHEGGKLNGNVLVMQNDTVLYESSFGYADGGRKHLLTPAHRFALGSIQKEFPGVAIMQLNERGLLSLEDSLSHFLPHLPWWADKISVRNLLQYSSGLPHVDWEARFEKGVARQTEILQDLSKLEELEFEPGTDYLYSNYNPLLLQSIVESLSGMPFKAYVEQNILLPFELDGIVIKEEYPYKNTELMAIPFDEDFKVDDYQVELMTVCSSARGMYTWFSRLDDYKIITKESMRQLSEEAMEGDNIQAPLGRCDWEDGDIKLHLHHGNSKNYESLVRHYKKDGLVVVLLTNQEHENLHDIADNIYALAQRKGAK